MSTSSHIRNTRDTRPAPGNGTVCGCLFPGLSRTGLLPASRPGPSVRPATTHCPYGLDRGLSFPLDDVDTADCLLLVGSNLAETMPPVMQRITRQRDAGGSLIVVDPRRTPTAAATLHLQGLRRSPHAGLARGAARRGRLLAGPGRTG